MSERRGIGIGRGAAEGPVVRMPAPIPEPPDVPSTEPAQVELKRAQKALQEVAAALQARAATAGGDGAAVLEAQALMAADPALSDQVGALIRDGATAARAVFRAFTAYAESLTAAGGYLAARVTDLADVRQRAVAACLGVPPPGLPKPGYPHVLVAHDLAPADTVDLDDTVLALVTTEGGPTSHTAILARAMGIPAVVACPGAQSLTEGEVVTVDAARGLVLPGAQLPQRAARRTTATGPGATADGHPVQLLANAGSVADAEAAAAAGAEGIGLLRTEFLFSSSEHNRAAQPPSIAEQTEIYRQVFAAFPGKRVVVRVLDAGADKPLPYLTAAGEPNPALGVRGIRALRSVPRVLSGQLSAVAAAAKAETAQVWVMAPMVSLPEEARWFAQQVRAHGLPVAGAMIEVPSAALQAAEILSEVDFVSIGTNDLSQYTFAADRQLAALARLHAPTQPALLKLIEMVGIAGAALDRPVGVCGEAAADPEVACVLVGLGVSSLSMAPSALAEVRDELAQYTLAECRALSFS